MKFGLVVSSLILAVTLISCSPEKMEAAMAESSAANGLDTRATQLVEKTQREPVAHSYKTAPYREGVAVLANETACYWVKAQVVYACNGVAKNWSNDVDFAPSTILVEDVKAAIVNFAKDGTADNSPASSEQLMTLTKTLSIGATTMNEKKAYSFYLGGEGEDFCDVAFTPDYARKSNGKMLNIKNDNDELNMRCTKSGVTYFISVNDDTRAAVTFIDLGKDAPGALSIEGLLTTTDASGRTLRVETKSPIPVERKGLEIRK